MIELLEGKTKKIIQLKNNPKNNYSQPGSTCQTHDWGYKIKLNLYNI